MYLPTQKEFTREAIKILLDHGGLIIERFWTEVKSGPQKSQMPTCRIVLSATSKGTAVLVPYGNYVEVRFTDHNTEKWTFDRLTFKEAVKLFTKKIVTLMEIKG